jgi:hypothetical protein
VAKKFSYSSFDIYLLSFIISNYLAAWFIDKYFLSEEEKTRKLAQNIISKSRRHHKFETPPASLK